MKQSSFFLVLLLCVHSLVPARSADRGQYSPPQGDAIETHLPAKSEIFSGWALWRHSGAPVWDAERRALFSTEFAIDAEGKMRYVECIRLLSQDSMTLTVLTRTAICGVSGYTYRREEHQAIAPGEFRRALLSASGAPVDEIWNIDPATGALQSITHTAQEHGYPRTFWKKPTPCTGKEPLVQFRMRADEEIGDWRPDPTGDPRYALSPDGNHLVYAFENASGAWSYIFSVYTREGDAWVEEPERKFFGSRSCPLDYTLTDEGILCMLADDELELCIPLFIPYTGSGDGLWYRGEHEGYAYPLLDAAREGQVEVVRALLTCPSINPGEVNDLGQDAAMLTDNPEIIAMVRAAQGPDYDRGKAIDDTVQLWRDTVAGKRPCLRNASPTFYLRNILRAKEQWMTEQANCGSIPAESLHQVRAELEQLDRQINTPSQH